MSNDSNNPLHMTAVESSGNYIVAEHQRRHKNTNTKELVDKWFIKPLRRMKDHDGFICLTCLFPLYEKHLRHKHNITGDFTDNHPVFREIGSHLEISQSEAYQFWQHFRNGLLHHATPKFSSQFHWVIRREGKPIERDMKQGRQVFLLNPFAIRDRLLQEIEADIAMWKQDDVLPAIEFRE